MNDVSDTLLFLLAFPLCHFDFLCEIAPLNLLNLCLRVYLFVCCVYVCVYVCVCVCVGALKSVYLYVKPVSAENYT